MGILADLNRAHRERLARMAAAAVKVKSTTPIPVAPVVPVAPVAPVRPVEAKSAKAIKGALRAPSDTPSKQWDAVKVALLRHEWDAGFPVAHIAAHLDTTESCIRGKAYRLDLAARPNTSKRGDDGRFRTPDPGGIRGVRKRRYYNRGRPRLWFTQLEQRPVNGHREKPRDQLDAVPVVAPTTTVPMRQIIDAVCKHFGISNNEIMSNRRSRFIAQARQVAYWLCSELTRNSLPAIGRALHKDHTSILHGILRVMSAMEADDILRHELDSLRRNIAFTAKQGAG